MRLSPGANQGPVAILRCKLCATRPHWACLHPTRGYLFRIDLATPPRRTPTLAQEAALDRAMAARQTCPACLRRSCPNCRGVGGWWADRAARRRGHQCLHARRDRPRRSTARSGSAPPPSPPGSPPTPAAAGDPHPPGARPRPR
ncbi:hypothetical protein ABZ697_27415 [Streptomyces albidoflavus]|nr:hypothetical protein [Streptomyces albidoflavus]